MKVALSRTHIWQVSCCYSKRCRWPGVACQQRRRPDTRIGKRRNLRSLRATKSLHRTGQIWVIDINLPNREAAFRAAPVSKFGQAQTTICAVVAMRF